MLITARRRCVCVKGREGRTRRPSLHRRRQASDPPPLGTSLLSHPPLPPLSLSKACNTRAGTLLARHLFNASVDRGELTQLGLLQLLLVEELAH
eukprot:4824076-Pleurochrysis_carterae.AAC.1